MASKDIDFSAMADSERVYLAHQLLQSVYEKPSPLTQADIDEIDRRVAEVDSGAVTCEDWEVVRERLRRIAK